MGKLEILDTTLRDGAQSESISYSVKDKLDIISALDEAGIDIIEAGNPGQTPKEAELFRELRSFPLRNSKIAAFCSTCRKDELAEDDPGLAAVCASGVKLAVLFGKTHIDHVRRILGTTPEENLRMVRDSVKYLTENGVEVMFDAEHFFDAFSYDRAYAVSVLKTASEAGATRLVLCDTNGAGFPRDIADAALAASALCPGVYGLHCHNDMGLAVAASIEGVQHGGITHIQGTFIGNGERCGNTCLSTLIPDLQLKLGESIVPQECLARFSETARLIAEVSNLRLNRELPYVGHSAFAHKAGIHADAVLKLPRSYEHIDPALVGNTRHLPVSEFAGRKALLTRFSRLLPNVDKNSPEVQSIHVKLKERESAGYQYEAAEGSLELIIRREIGRMKEFFSLIDLKLIDQQPARTGKSSSALIKLRVGSEERLAAAEGDGPVHAIDSALRLALREFYPALAGVHLTDYKVRVLTPEDATAAIVRVLIRSTDGGNEWSTVGVSPDIIEASFAALRDSIDFKLINDYENYGGINK